MALPLAAALRVGRARVAGRITSPAHFARIISSSIPQQSIDAAVYSNNKSAGRNFGSYSLSKRLKLQEKLSLEERRRVAAAAEAKEVAAGNTKIKKAIAEASSGVSPAPVSVGSSTAVEAKVSKEVSGENINAVNSGSSEGAVGVVAAEEAVVEPEVEVKKPSVIRLNKRSDILNGNGPNAGIANAGIHYSSSNNYAEDGFEEDPFLNNTIPNNFSSTASSTPSAPHTSNPSRSHGKSAQFNRQTQQQPYGKGKFRSGRWESSEMQNFETTWKSHHEFLRSSPFLPQYSSPLIRNYIGHHDFAALPQFNRDLAPAAASPQNSEGFNSTSEKSSSNANVNSNSNPVSEAAESQPTNNSKVARRKSVANKSSCTNSKSSSSSPAWRRNSNPFSTGSNGSSSGTSTGSTGSRSFSTSISSSSPFNFPSRGGGAAGSRAFSTDSSESKKAAAEASAGDKVEDKPTKAEDEPADAKKDPKDIPKPTFRQLRIYASQVAVPMVGFGIMDNLIMIQVGDLIDTTLGVKFGLATITAAAMGQVCSDVSGVCFGGVVDALFLRLGLLISDMTAEQLTLSRVKMVRTIAMALGVLTGCLIGMLSLLFMDLEKAARLKRQKKLQRIFGTLADEGSDLCNVDRCCLYIVEADESYVWTAAKKLKYSDHSVRGTARKSVKDCAKDGKVDHRAMADILSKQLEWSEADIADALPDTATIPVDVCRKILDSTDSQESRMALAEGGTKHWTVKNKQLLNLNDIRTDPRFQGSGMLKHKEAHSILLGPVFDTEDRTRVLGLVEMINKKDDDGKVVAFNADDEKLVTMLCHHCARFIAQVDDEDDD